MSDHLLRLDEVDSWGPAWKLTCHHNAKSRWFSTDKEGVVESEDCWLATWWEGLGSELLNLKDVSMRFPMPVRPSDDWDYDNGGRLVCETEDPPL